LIELEKWRIAYIIDPIWRRVRQDRVVHRRGRPFREYVKEHDEPGGHVPGLVHREQFAREVEPDGAQFADVVLRKGHTSTR